MNDITLDEIPFKTDEARERLRSLDQILGGLHLQYGSSSDECYLKLDIDFVKEGELFDLGTRSGKTPDKALDGILRAIKYHCGVRGFPLVVDAAHSLPRWYLHSTSERECSTSRRERPMSKIRATTVKIRREFFIQITDDGALLFRRVSVRPGFNPMERFELK